MKKENEVIRGGAVSGGFWTEYPLKLKFLTPLCASVPLNKDLIGTWGEARKPSVKPAGAKSIEEINEEVINRLPNMGEEATEREERTMRIFEQNAGFLCVRANTLRSHIKDCARQVQSLYVGKIKGERGLAQRVVNGLYVRGNVRDQFGTDLILIKKDGKPIKQHDGFIEKAIQAMTPQGKISALKNFAHVVDAEIEFVVRVVEKAVQVSDLKTILEYGATHGYGGERSMQYGQYEFELTVPSQKEVVTA